ncbi:MAG: hypothetical protein HN351_13035 [Deltaproteobacteria bacterium]|jgi:hypothetical protein|nr:hypothetical protein [Deltaproteobacteria bacterium]
MIVFPILNFVLPLMYSSFVLVANPQAGCTECGKKADLSVSENRNNEAVEQTNQLVIKDELTEEMHSGEVPQQIPPRKEE